MENYCEAYHLPFIHPGLNSYSRLEDHYNILDNEIYAGQGSNVFKPQLDQEGRTFPAFEGLSTKWDTAAEYCAFFPNVLFGVHKDHCYAILLIPNGQPKPPNGSASIMQMKQPLALPMQKREPPIPAFGKAYSLKILMWWRGCSAAAMPRHMMVGNSRPRWTTRPIIFINGSPAKCITVKA